MFYKQSFNTTEHEQATNQLLVNECENYEKEAQTLTTVAEAIPVKLKKLLRDDRYRKIDGWILKISF